MLHLFVLLAFLGSFASNARSLLVGDSVVLAYQFMGMSPRYSAPRKPTGFDAAAQKRQAQLVADLPSMARIEALAPETAMPLVLLSGRSIYALDSAPERTGERFIVATPADYRIWNPGPRFSLWRARYTRELFAVDGHALLQVDATAPPAPHDRRSLGNQTW